MKEKMQKKQGKKSESKPMKGGSCCPEKSTGMKSSCTSDKKDSFKKKK